MTGANRRVKGKGFVRYKSIKIKFVKSKKKWNLRSRKIKISKKKNFLANDKKLILKKKTTKFSVQIRLNFGKIKVKFKIKLTKIKKFKKVKSKEHDKQKKKHGIKGLKKIKCNKQGGDGT